MGLQIACQSKFAQPYLLPILEQVIIGCLQGQLEKKEHSIKCIEVESNGNKCPPLVALLAFAIRCPIATLPTASSTEADIADAANAAIVTAVAELVVMTNVASVRRR